MMMTYSLENETYSQKKIWSEVDNSDNLKRNKYIYDKMHKNFDRRADV